MEWTSSQVVGLIAYLLPGFVAAWVFYGLTAHRKQSPFERVVQAMILATPEELAATRRPAALRITKSDRR